jgi:HEAT repeat protein
MRRALVQFWMAGGLGLVTAGCTSFIDDVTSRNFRVRNMFSTPEPMLVLRTSDDGDARAKAMYRLKEPTKSAGSEKDQDEVMRILTESATQDLRPICRLAAIEALGRFDDPRTAAVLVQAYQASKAFTTEIANPIRCESLQALGRKNTPEALALLSSVASKPVDAPPASPIKQASYNPNDELNKTLGRYDPDAQIARETRMAAVRGLGQSTNAAEAAKILIPVLAEKDVALRDRAQESLQKVTGRRDVPAEPEAWKKALGMP